MQSTMEEYKIYYKDHVFETSLLYLLLIAAIDDSVELLFIGYYIHVVRFCTWMQLRLIEISRYCLIVTTFCLFSYKNNFASVL